jgi:hypothetical protein
MRRLLTICAVFVGLSTLALANSWSGRLLDESCYNRHQSKHGCNARASSGSYVLATKGSVYRFTAGSNDGISRTLQSRHSRRNPGRSPRGSPVWAGVVGTENDKGRIRVDRIGLQ